jgi:hypothetical protein
MSVEPVKIWEVVQRAVSHAWSVPEFQRGFVWKAVQVRDLAESLWLDYPIGTLLVWSSGSPQEERIAQDALAPSLWIVDGQQRATALSILFGRKPYWWESAEQWNKTLVRYDIRFDIDTKEPPFFIVANAAIRRAHGNRYVPLSDLLVLDPNSDADQDQLMTLARRIKEQDLCHGMDVMEVYARLDRVRKIRDRDVVTVTVYHELEDVVEIFARLNSRGTRVTEADIYLGIVASENPGWVRDEFLPFVRVLEENGFHIDPNLLFRTLTAIGKGKVRFQEIPKAFWQPDEIIPAWSRCKQAWESMTHRLQPHGILSDDPLPTKAALITLAALLDRFPSDPFEPALFWFLQASRFGRYSGASTTSLDEDLKEVVAAHSLREAISAILKRIPRYPMTPEDFLREYGDSRFGRFILYLLAYQRQAQDWDTAGQRLGFERGEFAADFRPQWHHIFPRKFLHGKFDESQIDALANIAVIGAAINIRISSQNPMNYLDRYKISDPKLKQQLIDPNRDNFKVEYYPRFLEERARALADAANGFLDGLRADLPLDPSTPAQLAPASV